MRAYAMNALVRILTQLEITPDATVVKCGFSVSVSVSVASNWLSTMQATAGRVSLNSIYLLPLVRVAAVT